MEERCRIAIAGPDAEALARRAREVIGAECELLVAESLCAAEARLATAWPFPPTMAFVSDAGAESTIARAADRLGLEPAQVVPFGDRPTGAIADRLARSGLRWQLWETDDADALRFVAFAASRRSEATREADRRRVPTHVSAHLETQDVKATTTILELGDQDAHVTAPHRCPRGAHGRLTFEADGGGFELSVRVEALAPFGGRADGRARVRFIEVDPTSSEGLLRVRRNLVEARRVTSRAHAGIADNGLERRDP